MLEWVVHRYVRTETSSSFTLRYLLHIKSRQIHNILRQDMFNSVQSRGCFYEFQFAHHNVSVLSSLTSYFKKKFSAENSSMCCCWIKYLQFLEAKEYCQSPNLSAVGQMAAMVRSGCSRVQLVFSNREIIGQYVENNRKKCAVIFPCQLSNVSGGCYEKFPALSLRCNYYYSPPLQISNLLLLHRH